MTKLFKVLVVGLASMALAFGSTACGGSDKTTTAPTSTAAPAATSTEAPATTAPTTSTEPDPNGVPPVTPAKGTTPGTCPDNAPNYDAATGLCYPNGAKMPE